MAIQIGNCKVSFETIGNSLKLRTKMKPTLLKQIHQQPTKWQIEWHVHGPKREFSCRDNLTGPGKTTGTEQHVRYVEGERDKIDGWARRLRLKVFSVDCDTGRPEIILLCSLLYWWWWCCCSCDLLVWYVEFVVEWCSTCTGGTFVLKGYTSFKPSQSVLALYIYVIPFERTWCASGQSASTITWCGVT
jgi:hypothetical protein